MTTGFIPPLRGSPIVRAFPFAYDMPGLALGVPIFTPAVGDLLLDAWVRVVEVFNGAPNAYADFGTFDGFDSGLWASAAGGSGPGILLSVSADIASFGAGVLVGAAGNQGLAQVSAPIGHGRNAPSYFSAPNPIKLVVSQSGELPIAAAADGDSAPTLPLLVVAGTNDEFVFTGSGIGGGGTGPPMVFTVPAGLYSTLDELMAAVSAATSGGVRFSTIATPSNDGGGAILLTMVGEGGAGDNGNTITAGTHDIAADLGYTGNPDLFSGGQGGPPIGGTQGAGVLYLVTATPASSSW